ncbi:MAG TPA: lysylphosphatidylglycerol synthase transmembrane domain-containing protein [Vicinamibacterales bacterium]|nr:lysylphosphatidylglycerol synthase transmembrane domain-containing protein [Vicinamibacterales bacterium]
MRAHLRTVVVVGLAVALLAWFLRNADLASVAGELGRGRPWLLALALAATLTTYATRSLRWQYLLRGVGPTRYVNALRATVIGFAASFLLPARAGELVRPYLLAQREGLPFTATFATVILERVLDLVTVLILFSAYLLLAGPGAGEASPAMFRAVKVGGIAAAAATTVVLAVFFFLAGRPEALGRAALRIERVLPARLAHLVARLAQAFAEGLAAVRNPQHLAMVLFWSFPLWLSIAAGIWLVTRAFHLAIPYPASFLIMTVLVVGVAVPTPGAVGGFHEAYRFTVTTFFAAPNDRAVGAALVLHAISFVPVTLVGIVFMAQEGLTLGRVRVLARRAGAKEDEG